MGCTPSFSSMIIQVYWQAGDGRVPSRGVGAMAPGGLGRRSGWHGAAPDVASIADGADGFQGHIARALGGPLVGLLEEDGADEPNRSCLYDVAKFEWRALWDRDFLRARYGEGFQAASPAGPGAAAPPRSGERVHATPRETCRVARPQRIRADAGRACLPGGGVRTGGADPTPPASPDARPRSHGRGRRDPSARAEEG